MQYKDRQMTDTDPPTPKDKARSPLWAKILVGFGAILMVIAGGGAVYAASIFNQVNTASNAKDLLGDGDKPKGNLKGPLNLLMIGTDLRVNDSDGEDRADTIMILHINKELTEATITSIPRDLKVDIPDCGNGQPCSDKINAAYQAGGDTAEERFQNLAVTLSDLTGIESFDGAAIVGFEGFLEAVKTMGSIDLCLPMDMQLDHQMREEDEVRTFKKGCNEYNSQEALWIVRERKAYDTSNPEFPVEYGVGDYGRQHMQQHFIKQLLVKAGEEGYITNPTKVGALIEDVGSSLTLDLNGHSNVDYAWALRGIKPNKLSTVRLPSETYNDGMTSYEVLPEGEPQQVADDLFTALKEDTMDEWVKKNPELINKDD